MLNDKERKKMYVLKTGDNNTPLHLVIDAENIK